MRTSFTAYSHAYIFFHPRRFGKIYVYNIKYGQRTYGVRSVGVETCWLRYCYKWGPALAGRLLALRALVKLLREALLLASLASLDLSTRSIYTLEYSCVL